MYKPVACFFIFINTLAITSLFCQRPLYKITADLDTSSHTLNGSIEIAYTNHADHNLDSLAIHLWPNAYKTRKTAFVNQKLNLGDLAPYRAKEEDLGGLYNLAFTSPDQHIKLISSVEHIDIGWIILSQSLEPGQTLHLSSPYTLQIPKSFSRLGRTGDSYQLTQWYPHLAVYDNKRWNTMPYLDLGEYFNDFADYEVTIRTPLSYKVAATGIMTEEVLEDQTTLRTFHAQNVIDFAWFTSHNFRHETKEVNVDGTDKVMLHLFVDSLHNEIWGNAMQYAERAFQFYSHWLGRYPYPQMTVVYTPFSKAGYMEYPMVAQISYTPEPGFLDRVIAHEIGHTWLYGILANNERKQAWLDEGFNTFIEDQYMNAYYQNPTDLVYPRMVQSNHSMEQMDALQHILRSQKKTVPPVTSPVMQQNDQYTVSAYTLPAQGLKLMAAKFGMDTMRLMFRQYYQDHQFSHVSSEDAQYSFEKICNVDLSWYFDKWIHHAHEIDYRIRRFNSKEDYVVVENRGGESIPLLITEFNEGIETKKHWVTGFTGEQTIPLQTSTDEIRLYNGLMAPNKQWWSNIKPQNPIPVVSFFPKIGNYDRPNLALTPVIGYNLADGPMPGIFITSSLLPQPKFKFLLAPFYGIESKRFRFLGEARFIDDLPFSKFDKILLSIAGSHFGYNLDPLHSFRDHFQRWSPSVGFRMKSSSLHTHVTKWLKYRYVDVHQVYGRSIDTVAGQFVKEKLHYGIHELAFQISSDTVLMPYHAKAYLQAGKGFIRLNAEYRQHFRAKNKMKGVWVHGFAGWLPYLDVPKANVLFSFSGTTSIGSRSNDYMFDEWLLGRNATEGNLTRQIFMKDAGLKTLSKIGVSDKWMLGGGASVALPFSVFHVYMDAALYPSPLSDDITFNYSGGLGIILMKDAFEIYIPLFDSQDIRESLIDEGRNKWHDRISFQANLKLANPVSLLDYFQFKY